MHPVIIVLWCIFLYTLWSVLLTKWWRKLRMTLRTPTLSGALPVIGHAHRLMQNKIKLFEFIKEISNESNNRDGVMKLWIGPMPFYIFTDPDDALTVSNACLKKNYIYKFVKAWIGEGLTSVDPPKWKRHRKLMSPAFNQHILNGFMEVFNEKSSRLVERITSKVGKGDFEHYDIIKECALETICHTAFGLPGNEAKVIDDEYKNAVSNILIVFMIRFTNIFMHFDFIYKWSSTKQREEQAVKTLHNKTNEVLQKMKASMKIDNKECNTITDRFKPILQFLLETGEYTDNEIRDEIDNIILAGHDTSANEMTYLLAVLGSHPEVQERIYDELQSVLGDLNRDVTKEDLPYMVYLEAVIKESLRLYPALPLVLRDIDVDLKLKNFTIPAGSGAVLSLWGINRHRIWGLDALEFNPDRWLEGRIPDHPAAFSTFSVGKRGCIGKHFALMSLKVTMAHLLRRYRVKADHKKIIYQLDVVMKPISGCHISVELR